MEQMLAGIAGMADTFMLEWLAAVVLILIAVAMSLFDLPGNTLMVGCCLGFAFYDPAKYFDIRIISAVILIYALGEIWEFVLSFFGIKRQVRSISWWGVFLIGCGTFVGTVMGTTAFPVAGSVIGGAIGAFAWRTCMNIPAPIICSMRERWPGRRPKCSSWPCWESWLPLLCWRFYWQNRFSFTHNM